MTNEALNNLAVAIEAAPAQSQPIQQRIYAEWSSIAPSFPPASPDHFPEQWQLAALLIATNLRGLIPVEDRLELTAIVERADSTLRALITNRHELGAFFTFASRAPIALTGNPETIF